ncbi:MAG: M20/M25/M40 family metallo-hydrolase [Acidobacteriota bacterium]
MLRTRFLTALFAGTLLLLPLPTLAAEAEPDLWVTMGRDAFDALRAEASLQPALSAQRFAEQDGVVVTRLVSSEIPLIAEAMHEKFHRCGGFMAHDSYAAAVQALGRADRGRLGQPFDYQLDQQGLVNKLQSELEESRIVDTIRSLSQDFANRFYSQESGENASVWIRNLWAGYANSRPDVEARLVSHSDWRQPSVELTIPGGSKADEVVVLGGHLDSVVWSGGQGPGFAAPGADDNASGIASLSEVIRVALANDFRPQRTIKFFGYAAEEVGLRGSQEIANSYEAAGTEVVGALQLDMTAFQGSAEDIALLSDFTDPTLTAFVGQLIDTYQPTLVRTSTACGYGCSDHAAWHAAGFPAVMSAEARFQDTNPRLHTTGDTLANLGNSAAHAIKFARLGMAFMVELGIDAGAEIFTDGFEAGNLSAWSESVP